MSGSSGDVSTTFRTCDAVMAFYLDLNGDEKERIATLVKEGGGSITPNYSDCVIVITSKKFAPAVEGKIFLPPQFVEDSITHGQQIFQDYALPPASDSFTGRSHYSVTDDRLIMEYIAKHPKLKLSGNQLWQQMEKEKVTKHSWHSMRAHYHKILLPKTKNGNVILSKKQKSSHDDENTYSAFPNGKPNTTTTTTTTSKGTKQNEDKVEASDEEGSQASAASSPSQDLFNRTNNDDNMNELLEHLLNTEDSPSPITKKTTKQTQKDSKTNSKSKSDSNGRNTPHSTPNTTSSTPSSSTKPNATPNRSATTPTSNGHSTPNHDSFDSGGEYLHHQIVYSQGKRRAATEKNIRGSAKRVRKEIGDIAEELQVPVTLVYHAMLVNSGDTFKAVNYLLANPLDVEPPWLPADDKVLKSSKNTEALHKLIEVHGKESCVTRTNFLDSSTVTLNTTT